MIQGFKDFLMRGNLIDIAVAFVIGGAFATVTTAFTKIVVADLDACAAFYGRAFGLPLVHREVNEEQGVEEAMLGTGAQGEENAQIQLLGPLSPDSTIGKWLEKNGGKGGIQQLAYRVTDLDAVSATLRERGLRLLYDAPRRGTSNSRVNFIHPKDAGGILVELVEPAASAH